MIIYIHIYIYIYINLIAEQQKFVAACNNFTGDMLSSTWTPKTHNLFSYKHAFSAAQTDVISKKNSFMHGYEVG